MVASKDMPPLPKNFGKVFWNNQFKVKIELPTLSKFPSLKGKVAIVTGANSGLGFESARQLLTLGLSHLVVAVRSIGKGKDAASKLSLANPAATIDVWALDMESYDSIQTFVRVEMTATWPGLEPTGLKWTVFSSPASPKAGPSVTPKSLGRLRFWANWAKLYRTLRKCDTELSRIDYTIMNAGISPIAFSTTRSTGHETAIQVNHISTILLTILLLPVLKAKSTRDNPARLTVINSIMAHLCKFPNRDKRPLLPSFDDTKITSWNFVERYGVSKLLPQLFLVKLTEHVKSNDVVINMVDPGLTNGTGLGRDASGLLLIVGKIFNGIAARPVNKGAATYINALLGHGKESHGCFLMNTEISPLATFYYTADGKRAKEQVWEETMKELSFAHVEEIVASMK